MTYLRAVLGEIFCVFVTLIASILVFSSGMLGKQKLATRLIRVWARIIVWTFGVRIAVEGEENLPKSGGAIVAFNHQSHLDIPALMLATDKQIRFGAKIELFKIPFFGAAMRSIGTLPIARDNRNEVLRIYKEASARCVADNILFVLAPEGTRQKEPRIGRFKKGPFVFAMNAHVPLVPAVIKGAFDVLPPWSWLINVGAWRRTIRVRFLPPIDSSRFTNESLDAFTSEAQAAMKTAFESL